MKTFTVKNPTTLKEFTDCTYAQGSFFYSALLKKGDIRVNGVRCRKDCNLKIGDEVIYYTTPSQEGKASHFKVYEDENIILADKLSGVSSEALFSELEGIAPYPVHRLDRNTAGLIVIAKTEKTQELLIQAFKDRTVEKIYYCLAKNNFKEQSATLTAYLLKDGSGTVKVYDKNADGRVKIITSYEVEKAEKDLALVKVVLHTGKTHQIRAHLAFIGCPLLGDTKYGDFALNKKYSATRQRLVAKSLKFNLSGELSYLNDKTFESSFTLDIP